MHIDHIAIWTTDIERMKNFYSTHFGCKASARYDNRQKQFSSYFLTFGSGARIEIMQRVDVTEVVGKESIGLAHFAVTVGTAQQVDLLTQKMEEAGVTVASYPRTTGDGYYESVVLDPDGNRIELTAAR
ncbi:VOC family protein [uncultured Acetobacteroides sp.]|uniref:VOC family protein n=1 Tax=uncultured Acetobacteroides sp. TaxID=1760811 RepID=UPI0029F47599|nr:VOC family protein [uncultured Acetobacteroides sp.]